MSKEDPAILQVDEQHIPTKESSTPVNYEAYDLTTRQRIFIFLGLSFALFLAALDQTIVATALPVIASEFSQLERVAWVVIAYMLGMTSIQPLFGQVCNLFGRKDALLFSVTTFLIGSVLCGAAQSMLMLIIARFIHGVGGGGIYTVVFIIMADVIPLRELGKYSSIISLVYTIANIMGPLLGGVFADQVSWRWIFYLNLPFCVLTIVFTLMFLRIVLPVPKDTFKQKLARLDVVGSVLIVASLTCLVLATTFISDTLRSSATWLTVGLLFGGCGVLLVAFVLVEHYYAKEPIMPLHLFKIRNVAIVFIMNFIFNMVFMSLLIYLPLYLQVVRGSSAMASGFQMIPIMLVTVIVVALTGLAISKTGHLIPFINVGAAIFTLGTGLMISLKPFTGSIVVEIVFFVVIGLGVGMMAQTTRIAAQAAVETKDMAVVTTLTNLTLTVGGLVGVAINSAIFGSKVLAELQRVLVGLSQDTIDDIANDVNVLRQQSESVQVLATAAYWEAFKLMFMIACPMVAVTLLLSLCLKYDKLKKHETDE